MRPRTAARMPAPSGRTGHACRCLLAADAFSLGRSRPQVSPPPRRRVRLSTRVTTGAIRHELRPIGLSLEGRRRSDRPRRRRPRCHRRLGACRPGRRDHAGQGPPRRAHLRRHELAAFREGLADLGLTFEQLMSCLGGHLCRCLPERPRLLALRAPSGSGPTRSAATRSSRSGSPTASARCWAATSQSTRRATSRRWSAASPPSCCSSRPSTPTTSASRQTPILAGGAKRMPDPPAAPTAFISYSWDDEPHKEWVRGLAARLRRDGIAVPSTSGSCSPATDCPPSWRRRSAITTTCSSSARRTTRSVRIAAGRRRLRGRHHGR